MPTRMHAPGSIETLRQMSTPGTVPAYASTTVLSVVGTTRRCVLKLHRRRAEFTTRGNIYTCGAAVPASCHAEVRHTAIPLRSRCEAAPELPRRVFLRRPIWRDERAAGPRVVYQACPEVALSS